jgi:hypothetical protein
MMKITWIMVSLALVFIIGCASVSRAPASNHDRADRQPIGVVKMRPDGVIEMQLRAEHGSIRGDAFFIFPPDHPRYEEIKSHVEGLKPGEEKSVPPWPKR